MLNTQAWATKWPITPSHTALHPPNGAELFMVDGGEADWPLPSLLDAAKHGADHGLLVNSKLRAWRMR